MQTSTSSELKVDLINKLETVFISNSDSVALSDGTEKLTYSQVSGLSNGIADKIIGLKEGQGEASYDYFTVGLYFTQTIDVVPALLGVLKSGSIYVPLEAYLPEARLKSIIDDAEPKVFLTNSVLLDQAKVMAEGIGAVVINIDGLSSLDSSPEVEIVPNHPAYIMYTSGSTGKPKGVVQTHKNIHFFCDQLANMLRVSDKDRIAVTTSFGHTVSVIDIFSHLLRGATVYMYDVKKERDLMKLREKFVYDKITVFHSIPNLFRLLFMHPANDLSIRLIILGGEDVRSKDFELYKQNSPEKCVFVNLYGSSELMIAFAHLMNKKMSLTGSRIPIGSPLKGVDYEIQGEDQKKKGVLSTGEMVFFSEYLTPGYWNLNSESLRVKDNTDEGFYRSGDLGRLLSNGMVEFKGRNDSMLKINGNRIELNEIEIVLDSHSEVTKTIVKVFERNDDQKFLVCFFITSDPSLSETELRKHLSNTLPGFMMPEMFVEVDEFPLNITGKVDRKTLDYKDFISNKSTSKHEPSTEVEHMIASIWKEVLAHDNFGIEDKFFDVGGNSLKLIELHSKLGNVFIDNAPSVQLVFDYQTVKSLANVLEQNEVEKENSQQQVVNDFEF